MASGWRCPTCGEVLAGARTSPNAVGETAPLSGAGRVAGPPPSAGPGTVPADGGESAEGRVERGEGPNAAAKAKGAPWHFKLLVVGVAGYMVYRVIWLIEWLPKHV
jgi:hypothetical protein